MGGRRARARDPAALPEGRARRRRLAWSDAGRRGARQPQESLGPRAANRGDGRAGRRRAGALPDGLLLSVPPRPGDHRPHRCRVQRRSRRDGMRPSGALPGPGDPSDAGRRPDARRDATGHRRAPAGRLHDRRPRRGADLRPRDVRPRLGSGRAAPGLHPRPPGTTDLRDLPDREVLPAQLDRQPGRPGADLCVPRLRRRDGQASGPHRVPRPCGGVRALRRRQDGQGLAGET